MPHKKCTCAIFVDLILIDPYRITQKREFTCTTIIKNCYSVAIKTTIWVVIANRIKVIRCYISILSNILWFSLNIGCVIISEGFTAISLGSYVYCIVNYSLACKICGNTTVCSFWFLWRSLIELYKKWLAQIYNLRGIGVIKSLGVLRDRSQRRELPIQQLMLKHKCLSW